MKLTRKLAVACVRSRLRVLSLLSKEKAAEAAFELFCTPQVRATRQLPVCFKEAEPLQFSFREYVIKGYRWNKGQSRKALLLHGFESTILNFEHYVAPLLAKGYEVLAFDAPAHGRSSGKMMDALVYCDFIKHIHREYGPVQSFLGHSFGGLALCLAISEIDHGDDYHIALVAPATNSMTAMRMFFRFLKINDPLVIQGFERIVLAKSGHPLSWFSIPRTLAQIRAKILWIHDENDDITPLKDAREVNAENHPHLQFVITKGLGHTRIYRDEAVCRLIVDFL